MIGDIRGELSSDTPVHFVCFPGNHDGTFKASSMARDILIERVREAGEAAIEDSVVSLCTEPQAAYFAFEKRMTSAEVIIGDPLWKQYRICIGEKRIGISAINAAWMSKVPDGQTGLSVDVLSALKDGDSFCKRGTPAPGF